MNYDSEKNSEDFEIVKRLNCIFVLFISKSEIWQMDSM